MGLLMLLAGFCFLCLCGAIGSLIISHKLFLRAFDMVNFTVGLHEQMLNDYGIDRREGTD